MRDDRTLPKINFKQALWRIGTGEWPYSHFIGPHIHTLKNLASQCSSITEFGTGHGASTLVFLSTNPKTLISYDINPQVNQNDFKEIVGSTNLEFVTADTANVVIQPTDLLFVDSLHTFNHVTAELKNADLVNRYLIFHDTEAFADHGELGDKGIWCAIREWWYSHFDSWDLIERCRVGCGLTVFRRIQQVKVF